MVIGGGHGRAHTRTPVKIDMAKRLPRSISTRWPKRHLLVRWISGHETKFPNQISRKPRKSLDQKVGLDTRLFPCISFPKQIL